MVVTSYIFIFILLQYVAVIYDLHHCEYVAPIVVNRLQSDQF